jgi:hypothetical protein
VPLVERQHPHDLFMELAARIDIRFEPFELTLGGSVNAYAKPDALDPY